MRTKNKLLYPFSLLYRLVVDIRNFLFDVEVFHSKEFEIPIISIGNITVGGTGKTPHVLYLVNFLKDKYQLATLSRGYKRKTKGFLNATEHSTSLEIGDEPKLIKQTHAKIKVAVDANRVNGINKLLSQSEELELILLDDAYQHRWVKAGLSILLVDYNRPLKDDSYLPYGNLRENASQKKRANIVIVTKTPENIKPMEQRVMLENLKLFAYQSLFFTRMKYQNLINVFDRSIELNIEMLNENNSLLVVTGIAQADDMISYLKQTKANIKHLKFSDHHNFKNGDIETILHNFRKLNSENKFIITTEKDAMRLNEFSQFDDEIKRYFYFLPIKVAFLNNQENEFQSLILEYLKGNSKMAKKPNYNFNKNDN